MQATSARPVCYGHSVSSLEVINRELKDKARGIVLAQIMSSLRNTAQPSASQFEGFVRTMEGAGEIAFGRFTAKYSPQSHNGSDQVELAIIDAEGRLRY